MALAVRTNVMQQEEPLEVQAPRLRQRRRPVTAGWAKLALTTLSVSFGVGLLVTYVNTYARIAELEMQRESLKQEYAQLNRACIETNLELEQLATQPQLARIAQVQGLELPEADRVHYIQGNQDYPRAAKASATVTEPSWARRSGRQLLAALGTAWQVLGGGATTTAYAQD
ncbi:MAG: hypothetical protein ACYDCO_23985 [Armatimonadota bacterium]